ncbi:hypothetical protein MD484_g1302, partial [Candolleomyces efflorescens]
MFVSRLNYTRIRDHGLVFLALAGLSAAARDWGFLAARDNVSECTPYYYAPVNSRLSSFPTIWQPASILHGDINAEAKWDSIKRTVPDIPPKGTPMGDFTGLKYPENDTDCWWTYSKCVSPNLPGLPKDVSDVPEPHTLAYGFDDGPNCSHNAFYDYLMDQGQKATMFYIGSNVMDWPLEAQRAVSDGHEICVHTWSHRYMTGLTSRDAFAELYYSAYPVPSNIFVAWVHILHLSGIEGGVSSEIVDANYELLLKESESGVFDKAGAILLAHELNNFTMSEAVKYYERLKSSFKNLVPLAVALNHTHPYVEGGVAFDNFDDYTSSDSPNTGAVGSNATLGNSATPTATGQSIADSHHDANIQVKNVESATVDKSSASSCAGKTEDFLKAFLIASLMWGADNALN